MSKQTNISKILQEKYNIEEEAVELFKDFSSRIVYQDSLGYNKYNLIGAIDALYLMTAI